MALESKLLGSTSGNGAEVTTDGDLKVIAEQVNTLAGVYQPGKVGAIRVFNEIDSGANLGTALLRSADVDLDFRNRVAHDILLDSEIFSYTAQNTGKFILNATTMTGVFTAGNFTTNGSSITTTTTGLTLSSYAFFPIIGTNEIVCDMEVAFSAAPVTNTIIDFGLFVRGAANPFAPLDGCYFRLNSAGLQAVINSAGSEVTSDITFTYTNSKKYQYSIVASQRRVEFYITDAGKRTLVAALDAPDANGLFCMSGALPFSIRHAITGGAAGGVLQAQLGSYTVHLTGGQFNASLGDTGNRMYGSHQGLSGGTLGSLANYANSANPTAAVATNTTAALGTGLGGQFWETATLAVNTDGIICSYQVPAGSATVQGRRLKIKGVGVAAYVQAAITGGPCIIQLALCFGHSAVSLATAEAATTKAPRRVALPELLQVTAGQAVSTPLTIVGESFTKFDEPIYVNPGEFVAIAAKKIGTAITAGVIAYVITFDYSWE